MKARTKEKLIENIIELSNSVSENVKQDLLDYWKVKQLYMKNGVFCLENDAKTTNDMIFELQEENTQLTKENTGLKEQVAYLRRSCERKEEKIYEQYDELVGLDTKIDRALKKINDYKIYCKENKGFTEYTDIEIEAIEPVLTKIENILKEM